MLLPAGQHLRSRGRGHGVQRARTMSSVVDRAARDAVLVEPPRQMQPLEQKLHRGGHDRRLLGAIGHIERAEAAHARPPAREPRASRPRSRAMGSDRRSPR